MISPKKAHRSKEKQSSEMEELRAQLAEAKETLRAIHEGEVDAVIVSGSQGEQVFSLFGAESIYRLIVETMKEAAFTVTVDGQILYCNARFGEFVKRPISQILGHSLNDFLDPANHSAADELLIDVQQRPMRHRLVFADADGHPVPAHISATVLNQPDGLSICVVATDLRELENSTEMIRQLRRQQEELRQSELEQRRQREFLECLIANAGSCIAVVTGRELRCTLANPAFRLLAGEVPMVGRTFREVFPEAAEAGAAARVQRVLETGEPWIVDAYRAPVPGKPNATWQGTVVRLPLLNGQEPSALAVIWDITERIQVEEELYLLNKTLEDRVAKRTVEIEQRALQLRQLASELTLAEQRERQRISLVLHDGLQQILVAAKFKIALLEKTKEMLNLTELAELIDDGIETSRSLTAELSPPILKQGGLVPALEWLISWMRDKHGLTVTLISHGKIESAPEEVVILLFQSVRELLFNVAKHAGIRTARVEVMQEAGRIRIDVADEGVGFDPIQIQEDGIRSRGMGLFSIQERLRYLGGLIEIDSAPGRGSRFKLITPPIPMKMAVLPIHEQSIVSISMASQRQSIAGSEKIVRVVLVDDHMVMRQGLAGLLRSVPDIEIIGEASDGHSAVELIRELRPDVVLMDVSMPGMDGIQATRIVHKELPEVRIIALSMFQEGEQQVAMREAGAATYLSKTGPAEEIINAIRARV